MYVDVEIHFDMSIWKNHADHSTNRNTLAKFQTKIL